MRWLIVLAAVFALAGINVYIGSSIIPPDWQVVYAAVWCPLSGLVVGGIGTLWAWQ